MSLIIHLVGTPRVERGGVDGTPRGRKTWALLAYLLLTEAPPSRRNVAELLFQEADDPLGALRWGLSDLRRLLGEGASLGDDPLRLALPAGTVVDVEVLVRGSWVEAVRLPGLGRDLIEGLSLPASPGFELWLASERRHLAGAAEAALREAVLASLARGDPGAAADHAFRLVGQAPYDENHHVLLVRSLSTLGDHEAAARQVGLATELFRRELGVDPSPALRAAAAAVPAREGPGDVRATVLARLEAGEAAVAAGALETGLIALRRAVAGSREVGDHHLLARSLVVLGSTLVHAARGTDEEGAVGLYEACSLAEEMGDGPLGATARRELAWIEFLRARYDRAQGWLAQAAELAGGDETEMAWVELIAGGCHTDTGDYGAAFPALRSAVERADRAGADRTGAVAGALLGRAHLLSGETGEARRALDRSLERARREGWTAFVAWPESLIGETLLREGDVDGAAAAFEHAFALGCQVGDPCWESIAARGLGLVAAAQGDVPGALQWLEEAPRRCRRLPDSWLWVEAYALDALCQVAVARGAPAAPRWIGELEALAARAGMRELLARATLHRARLGDPGALEAARMLAAGIDNPALAADLAAAGG
ncbi:MAG: SARP family transcriptional regulator [Actinobacteria bacterium]|nr:SARP family transcriptional regulator [Actinomycetota bacterium]